MSCCYKRIGVRKFVPNYKEKSITDKFYSRHDSFLSKTRVVNPERYLYFQKEIEKRQHGDIRKEAIAPITSNQIYGWFAMLADPDYTDLDKEILVHKRSCDPIMDIMKKVAFDTSLQNKYTKKV
uniref:Uncharacterized protein n=1 Tax=Glossina austeni TaxID=7395 RepID=A0A1A9V8V2_GLOAU